MIDFPILVLRPMRRYEEMFNFPILVLWPKPGVRVLPVTACQGFQVLLVMIYCEFQVLQTSTQGAAFLKHRE